MDYADVKVRHFSSTQVKPALAQQPLGAIIIRSLSPRPRSVPGFALGPLQGLHEYSQYVSDRKGSTEKQEDIC